MGRESDDPQILTFGPRRRGRPSLSPTERSTGIHLRLPESDYDATYRAASARRMSVPDLVRRALKEFIADERGGVLRYRK